MKGHYFIKRKYESIAFIHFYPLSTFLNFAMQKNIVEKVLLEYPSEL